MCEEEGTEFGEVVKVVGGGVGDMPVGVGMGDVGG